MHWFVVLIISAFTYGLGYFVWGFRQAFFVKRLDPASKSVKYLTLSCGAMVLQVALYFAMMNGLFSDSAFVMMAMVTVTNVVIVIFVLVSVFGMRRALLNYYNSVEPIGLRLSGVMTFFFSILYFQYHFSRIVAWKKTGVLK